MQQVLCEHRRHSVEVAAGRAWTPLLLALTVDERERLHDLLAQVFRTEKGLLVDATAYPDSAALDGDPGDVADLVAAVNDALAEINELPDAVENLRLTLDTDTVTIAGATDFTTASRAQQALRSMLISLFATDLRANELAGLNYAEDALDEDHRAIVWRLLMRLPALLHRPPNSTLVVVAGDADIQSGLHCTGDPSLRWRVYDRGLQRRHTRAADRDAVDVLTRTSAHDAPLVMLMVGAGASAGYLPTGNEVRNVALEHLTGKKVDRHTYPDVAAEFFARLGRAGRLLTDEDNVDPLEWAARLTLERVLREEQHEERRNFSHTLRWFNVQHDQALGRIEAARVAGLLDRDPLVRLVALRRRLLLVTVNFDQIIEAKCGADVRPFVTDPELADLPKYLDEYSALGADLPVPLVKAHGDIRRPETIVADITTTRSGLGEPVFDALADIRERMLAQDVTPLWHVGYSMRDLDLADYWADPRFADRAAERWVGPMPDPAVERFIREKRLPRWTTAADPHTADESMVTLTATDFFELLVEFGATRW